MDYESSGVSVCGKINNLEEGLQPTDNDGTERLRNLIENICNEVDMATFTLRMVRWLISTTSSEMLDQRRSIGACIPACDSKSQTSYQPTPVIPSSFFPIPFFSLLSARLSLL